ncbi:DnaJ domain containing protein [Sesbania bispinosa]|nr:DnaJ domain containing protein [Sesbania bispinosa]
MQIPRWRNLLSMKTYVIPSATHFSAFHSTPCSCQKWKSKWNSEIRRDQQPSKSHIKYITRQKRADAKKALKNLLYNSGSSKFSFEDTETKWKPEGNSNRYGDQHGRPNSYSNKGQPKSGQRFGGKSPKKNKGKIRRESFFEDFDGNPEQIFQATFGNRWYTWSFSNLKGSSEYSTSGFEWREHSDRTNKWKSTSDAESDDDGSCSVGSSSDRSILGLPPTGPLKIEDVKTAFRLSALKWHPDKHQGPSQVGSMSALLKPHSISYKLSS